jgi:adenylosuccinate lyase
MPLTTLNALSPLDGRYQAKVAALAGYFSEYALIRYRVRVEVEWLLALAAEPGIAELPPFTPAAAQRLSELAAQFGEDDARAVKDIEAQTNHDVKAIEYWLRTRLADMPEVVRSTHFIHFACTSEDINNLCYALMLKDSREQVLLPAFDRLVGKLTTLAHTQADLAMLSRTHGQAATPTTLGKEMANFAHRLRRARARIAAVALEAKFNGAVGNYNAHLAAYPTLDWEGLCRRFVEGFGLRFNAYTTQIEPHDSLTELLDGYCAANAVLLALDRDMWGYISLGYLRQRVEESEVGSSTMPHKVNPIDFENSEGNIGIANALLQHLSGKLPVSRWQRDLSDSTALRNVGVALGHTLLACESAAAGLDKVEADPARLREDLDAAWEVLAEPIQTVLRRCGVADPYERLKALTRGKQAITRETLHAFVRSLDIPEADKAALLALTPSDYLGLAASLARRI